MMNNLPGSVCEKLQSPKWLSEENQENDVTRLILTATGVSAAFFLINKVLESDDIKLFSEHKKFDFTTILIGACLIGFNCSSASEEKVNRASLPIINYSDRPADRSLGAASYIEFLSEYF